MSNLVFNMSVPFQPEPEPEIRPGDVPESVPPDEIPDSVPGVEPPDSVPPLKEPDAIPPIPPEIEPKEPGFPKNGFQHE
ncbi:hypothetical protein D3C76_1414530 [compost metagenome]